MPKHLAIILPLFIIICLSLSAPAQAAGDEQHSPQPETPGEKTKENSLLKKLRGNDPSYFVMARDNNNSFDHIEFYLSVEYPLLEKTMHGLFGPNSDLYFNYNGKYDFYLIDRYSSPVISRRQNPGIMFEHRLTTAVHGLTTIKTGYFHESNGQTIDTAADYASTANAADIVSRGWDYIPLELQFDFPTKLTGFSLLLKGRYFMDKQLFKIDKEDEIFWDPADDAQIEDYAGLSLTFRSQTVISNDYIEGLKFAAIYRSGYKHFNLSQRYEATFRALGLPFYIFYFNGYGTELATYHERGNTLGIGVEFW